jgi:hypothetical protein
MTLFAGGRCARRSIIGIALFFASPVRAQTAQAPTKPAAAPAKPAAAPAKPSTDEANDDDAKSGAAANLPAEPHEPPAEAAPPPPPRGDEQQPAPYLRRAAPLTRVRHVDVGLDAGITHRPAEGDGVSYSAAFAFGGYARIEVEPWLGVRAYVLKSDHPVSVSRGALGLGDNDVSQPNVDVTLLAIRAEPTWVVTPRIRLWAGIGIGWSFFAAEEPTVRGTPGVRTADRHGVGLEPSFGLGGSFDAIPHWLSVSLINSASFVTNQSGDMFEPVQGLNSNGSIVYAGGLPEFGAAYSALLAVGALL